MSIRNPVTGDTVSWYRDGRMRFGKLLRVDGLHAVIRSFRRAGGEERVLLSSLERPQRPLVPVPRDGLVSTMGIDLPAPYAASLDALELVSRGGYVKIYELREELLKLGYITVTHPGRLSLTAKGREILQ